MIGGVSEHLAPAAGIGKAFPERSPGSNSAINTRAIILFREIHEANRLMKTMLSPLEKVCIPWLSRGMTLVEIALLEGKASSKSNFVSGARLPRSENTVADRRWGLQPRARPTMPQSAGLMCRRWCSARAQKAGALRGIAILEGAVFHCHALSTSDEI
ncbi:hypothetical protein [Rhizobium sp. H4]|uniref:hypothetical protein n=1 Tax=Rhizobium sp. H4 TaxID=2035449 RepID=UPI00148578FA|nr:hypothetical protein [Rhizobium sp. H4]